MLTITAILIELDDSKIIESQEVVPGVVDETRGSRYVARRPKPAIARMTDDALAGQGGAFGLTSRAGGYSALDKVAGMGYSRAIRRLFPLEHLPHVHGPLECSGTLLHSVDPEHIMEERS